MPVYYPIPTFTDGTKVGSEQLIKRVLADYLSTDTLLMSWLGAGNKSGITEDGVITQITLTPLIQVHFTGLGDAAGGLDVKVIRFILHVVNRNRGFAEISRIIERVRFLINSDTLNPSFRTYATFDPAVTPYSIVHAKAGGQTSNITMNRYEAVAIGLYLQVYMRGYPVN